MRLLLAGIALTALIADSAIIAGPAIAADMPIKAPSVVGPTYSWTGFYLGSGIGLRSSQVDGDVSSAVRTPPGGAPINLLATGCPGAFGFACVGEPLNDTTFRISAYGGYNYQISAQWLAGIEADAGFGRKTTTIADVFYPNTRLSNFDGNDSFAVSTKWDASLRGRLGYLVTPSLLIYVTGGLAWQDVQQRSSCSTNPDPTFNSLCGPQRLAPAVIEDSTTKLGYTVGLGMESMVWSNWLLRGEYRYADFGTISFTDTRTSPIIGSFVVTDKLHLRTQTAMLGLAYQFTRASAADVRAYALPPLYTKAPSRPPSWTGLYIGGDIGLRSTKVDGTVPAASQTPPGGPTVDLIALECTGAFGVTCTGQPLNGTAFRISPYVGYNYQFGPQWLAGIEGDVGLGSKTTTVAGEFYPLTPIFNNQDGNDSFALKATWDASVRGRLGFLATPSLLVYATGGAAWQHIAQTSNCSTNVLVAAFCSVAFGAAPAVITDAATKPGYTVGGGMESMLWSNWLLRGEYRYADFGTVSFTDRRASGIIGVLVVNDTLRVRTHTASVGLAYKFGP